LTADVQPLQFGFKNIFFLNIGGKSPQTLVKTLRNHMLPKGILFDLDDTIITFESVAKTVWGVVCEHYYKECGLSNAIDLLNAIVQGRIEFWSDKERSIKARQNIRQARRDVIKHALSLISIDNATLSSSIADEYTDIRDAYIQFFPGAKQTLEYLKSNDVALGLITNGEAEYQRQKVERFNLVRYFDVILIEGELGFGKPDKKIYITAMEALNLPSSDLWCVGDNLEADVWGAQQAGIYGIWNDYNKAGLPKSSEIVPDRIINSISELKIN